MTSKPSMEVALRLTGTGFSPEDVTAVIQLAPTRTWRLGDPVEDTKLMRKHDGWVFGLSERDTYEMDSFLRELLGMLEPYKERIAQATSRFCLEKDFRLEFTFEVRPRLRGSPLILYAEWPRLRLASMSI